MCMSFSSTAEFSSMAHPTRGNSISPVEFSSVKDGSYALGKAHMRSTPSLRSFSDFAFETVPMFV